MEISVIPGARLRTRIIPNPARGVNRCRPRRAEDPAKRRVQCPGAVRQGFFSDSLYAVLPPLQQLQTGGPMAQETEGVRSLRYWIVVVGLVILAVFVYFYP
ncbi:MAG: hypothetical protein OXF89_19025, partial [Rhodospirillaceae bacterium]|nr:hypothetical protein [Rhodospirillaceae bacterium]